MTKRYEKFFAIDEIARSKRLQCIFAVSWFLCVFDLLNASRNPLRLQKGGNCWAYWLDCTDSSLFNSITHSVLYSLWTPLIFALLVATAWSGIYKKWGRAHFFLSIVLIFKCFSAFVLVNDHNTNFELFHLVPSFVLLFTRDKLRGIKIAWVLTYLFAAKVKFDESWIVGSYFSSMTLGLPLLPRFLIPFVTNGVIIFEIICSVGLISRNRRLRKFSFWSWTAFHIYSATLVGYYYPTRCLGFLWAIFAFPEWDRGQVPESPRRRFGLRTIAIGVLIIVINLAPTFISEDNYSTFEGLDYGFFMLNSNYQCRHDVLTSNAQGEVLKRWSFGRISPMARCFPQDILQIIKRQCKDIAPNEHISWIFWESRNGSPFYELINEKNACALTYKPFARNEWIHLPANSKIVGYPEKNIMSPQQRSNAQMPVIHDSPLEEKSSTEKFLQQNYFYFRGFYMALWWCRFLFMLGLLFLGPGQFLEDNQADNKADN